MPGIIALQFKQDGVPKMLSSDAAIRKAIENGDIDAGTSVTAYFDDGSSAYSAAGDQAALASMFPAAETAAAEVQLPEASVASAPPPAVAPTGTEPKPEPTPEPTPEPEPAPTSKTEPEPEPEVAQAPEPTPPPVDIPPEELLETQQDNGVHGTTPYGGEGAGNPFKTMAILAGIAIVLFAGYQFASDTSGETAEYEEPIFEDSAAAVEGAIAASKPVEPEYDIDESTAGAFRIIRASEMLDAPDGLSIGNFSIGERVNVIGTVDGLAYVSNDDGLRGFVDWGAINGNPYIDQEFNLVLVNNCSSQRNFLFFFHDNGWRTNPDQTLFMPGFSEFGRGGSPVRIDRLEIYYYEYPADENFPNIQTISEREIRVDGQQRTMTAAIPEIVSSSPYDEAVITFGPGGCP